jgi:prepilin-type N-terminal cleavage/methylation domain-containing protein
MLRSRLRADEGFTLVELLVAILIVGVLIAVGLASFLDQREKAQDAEAKAAAVTATTAMVVYSTQHDGTYTGATPAALVKIEKALGEARGLTVEATADTFNVSVRSASPESTVFSVALSKEGASTRDCTNPGVDACRSELDANGDRW